MKQIYNWLNSIQLLPARCLLCDAEGHRGLDLCAACLDDLPLNLHCCYLCGEIFAQPIPTARLCGHCLSRHPSFDETHAPFLYQDAIRYLITGLKFGQRFKHARLLGTLVADYLRDRVEHPEYLIPVPLHPSRYRERGFNQSIEIAHHIGRQLQIPVDLNSCSRTRDTGHQTGLPAKQRRKNMRAAFSVSRPIRAQHVAVIDDVMTTGATVSALATALKQAGVARVDVWVCARA